MTHSLVLFCGGRNAYNEASPKPLKLLPNKRSLIYNFLQQTKLRFFSRVFLLVEENLVGIFANEVQISGIQPDKVMIIPVSNESTTLEKLQEFLQTEFAFVNPIILSYPDIFYFGDLSSLLGNEARMSSVIVSGVFLQSRFPMINLNPYTGKARSVSLNPSRVPANASVIFGGHISSSATQLRQLLLEFDTSQEFTNKPSLEGDFLKFLANRGLLDVVVLFEKWLKSDSTNEEIDILDKLSEEIGINQGVFSVE